MYVTGSVENEPDLHDRLIAHFKLVTSEEHKDLPPLHFKSIPNDYTYYAKKTTNEQPSTDGILKANWFRKHSELIPSVVVMLASFSVDWPVTEWYRRENATLEMLNRVRAGVNSREIRIILVVLRTGVGSMDKDVFEERINSLKKHVQMDGRNFALLSTHDIAPTSSHLRRVAKTIRDYSSAYYISQGRRLKTSEKNIRLADSLLIARYNVKVSYFYEFQGQSSRSLRHYRQSFQALVDMIEPSDESILMDQIKAVAEMVNFKICAILLKTGMFKDAAAQMRQHLQHFLKLTSKRPWAHFAWISDQYVIYAQLLTQYAVNPTYVDADRAYYYQNAALFAAKRLASFKSRRGRASEESITVSQKFPGMEMRPPKFVGGPPLIVDPVLDRVQPMTEDVKRIIRAHYLTQEKEIDHISVILSLLRRALECVNPVHKRRRAYLRTLVAKQHMSQGNYDLANVNLAPAAELYSRDKWVFAAVPVLKKKMQCCVYLGRSRDYLTAALQLYALASKTLLGKYDKDELHRDIMATITNTEKPTEETRAKAAADEGMGYTPLPLRAEYGSNAVEGHAPEYFLPDGYTIDFSEIQGLFSTKVWYESRAVEVGCHVRTTISITSHFHGTMNFAEMSAHFTDDTIVQRFVHDGSSSGDSQGGVDAPRHTDNNHACSGPIEASLVFPPNVAVKFSFDMLVPESALSIAHDSYICLEKIRLAIRLPIPLKMSEQDNLVPDIEIPSDQVLLSTIEEEERAQLELEENAIAPLDEIIVAPPSPHPQAEGGDELKEELLEEVGDFQSANPNESSEVVEENLEQPAIAPDIFDQRIDDDASDEENELEQKSDVGLESFEEYDPMKEAAAAELAEQTPNSSPEPCEAQAPEQPPAIPEVFPVDEDITYEEDLTSAVRVQRARTFSSAPVVDFAALIERGYREVLFEVPVITRAFAEARTGQGKFVSLVETAQFLGRDGPPVLQIMKPSAELTLESPTEPISILQGAIQRINLVFQTGQDKLINARVFLSSDYTAPANGGPELFWYPDVNQLLSCASTPAILQTPDFMDSVHFSPFALNSSFQPAQPLLLWNTTTNSEVCCPIFIKSDLQGPIAIKARVEYIPKDILKATVSREFSVQVNVVKPFSMNFNVISMNESHCGVDRKQASSVVLRGEHVNVSACLDCVGSLGRTVEIASMEYVPPAADSLARSLFSLLPSSGNGDLLSIAYQSCRTSDALMHSYVRHCDESRCVVLKKGEAYVGSVDIRCNSSTPVPLDYPPTGALRSGSNGTLEVGQVSMGAVSVRWRLDDITMFLPHDYMQQLSQHTVPDASKVLAWLPSIAAGNDDEPSIMSAVQKSRVCSAIFTIPSVKVFID